MPMDRNRMFFSHDGRAAIRYRDWKRNYNAKIGRYRIICHSQAEYQKIRRKFIRENRWKWTYGSKYLHLPQREMHKKALQITRREQNREYYSKNRGRVLRKEKIYRLKKRKEKLALQNRKRGLPPPRAL